MKTLVYQSFRTTNVPNWINTCLSSVKKWSDLCGFTYCFIDDAFFDYAPEAFKQAVNNQRHLVSDLARLELAHHYLEQGWERVIWVDADLIICDPENFSIDNSASYLFCRELWMTLRDDNIVFSERVNNSIAVFCKNNNFLDFYRSACHVIVKNKQPKLAHTDIGTGFLTKLIDVLPLIKTSVVFSPFLLSAFYRNDQKIIADYLYRLAVPIQAVNLCLTFRNMQYQGLEITDEVFSTVIDRLQVMNKIDTIIS